MNQFDETTFNDYRPGRRLAFIQRQQAESEAKDAAGHAEMLKRDGIAAETCSSKGAEEAGRSNAQPERSVSNREDAGAAVPATSQQRSWRDSVAAWHKGAPPHDGKWPLANDYEARSAVSKAAILSRGSKWPFKNGFWVSLITGNNYEESIVDGWEWFGHAPDSEGWIKWEGGECPLPDGVRFERAYRYGEIGDEASHARAFVWGECGLGTILAYRVLA